MTVKKLLEIIGGELLSGNENVTFNNISIDTRTLKFDDLFIALKGKKTDGNKYINEAIKKGCSVIITEKNIAVNKTVIKVGDCYQTLFLLAKYYLKKYNISLVAVTGSVGKTLTKELISNILKKRYNVLKSSRNYNNHIGIPLTLFNLNEDHQIIVLEFGMNHLNEISNLSKLCNPTVSVITKIGSAHIGNLGSKKEILKAKTEIIDGMNNGPLIINGDDKYLNKIKYSNIVKCGLNHKNDLIAYDIICSFNKTKFKIEIDDNTYEFVFNIPGKHLITDVLIAIEVGLLFNINYDDIKSAVEEFIDIYQRMNIINLKNNNVLIDDSYNASYESVIGGLEVIKKSPLNKIIILGDVLELGKYSNKIHYKILKKAKKIPNSLIFLVGNEFTKIKKQYKNVKTFSDVEVLKEFINVLKFNNTLFYIKGSRAINLEKIVENLKKD